MNRPAKFHAAPEVRVGKDPRTAIAVAHGTYATLMVAGLSPSKAIRCTWSVKRDGLFVRVQPWFAMAWGITWYSAGHYRIPLLRYWWLKLRRSVYLVQIGHEPVDPMPRARTVRR